MTSGRSFDALNTTGNPDANLTPKCKCFLLCSLQVVCLQEEKEGPLAPKLARNPPPPKEKESPPPLKESPLPPPLEGCRTCCMGYCQLEPQAKRLEVYYRSNAATHIHQQIKRCKEVRPQDGKSDFCPEKFPGVPDTTSPQPPLEPTPARNRQW